MALTRHTMLDFPLMFGDEVIPQPGDWQESSTVIETVNETEAGTTQVDIVRYDRLSISVTFNVTDEWAKKLKAYSKQSSIQVKYYDIESDGYKTRTMRIRKFSATLASKSNTLLYVRGAWKISFNLEEF